MGNMKVGEILELTASKRTSEIAKEHLTIGEKRLREALKKAGCVHENGKKGWTFPYLDTYVLEQSIYDFVADTEKHEPKASTSNGKPTKRKASINKTKHETMSNDKRNVGRKSTMKEEIDALITGNNKESQDKGYKGFYLDKDIIGFLNNVPKGNQSKIVNMVLRQYLIDNGYLK